MAHHHHSHSSHQDLNLRDGRIQQAYIIGISLNLLYTVVEYILGYLTGSLALISDASHNLSDVASLVISLIGNKFSKKSSNSNYTYGLKKASILASLINAVIILTVVLNILIEAFKRFQNPPETNGKIIIITAFIGVIINFVSALLFYKDQKEDINIRGAFLHLSLDALVSLGVVLSGVLIYIFHWYIFDLIISIIVALVIFFSTWNLFKESLKLILDGVPESVDFEKVKLIFNTHSSIQSVHHLHLWALSSTENALTAHIVLKKNMLDKGKVALKKDLKHQLAHANVGHVTLEIEDYNLSCESEECP